MLLNILDTQPTDIWHDTAFQFVVIAIVTLLAGIIGAIVAYWIYRKQRNRKELSYQLVSVAPIAFVSMDFKDRVEIKFDGKPIENMSLLILKIWNSGNVAIKPHDYFETIKFEFKGEFEGEIVVGSEVLDTVPHNLIDPNDIKTFLKHEQDWIELPKFPLNPNETIELKVLFTGTLIHISKRGRIADGNIVETNPYNQLLMRNRRTRISLAVVLGVLTILLIGGISVASVPSVLSNATTVTGNQPLSPILTVLLLLFIIIITFATIILLFNRKPRNPLEEQNQRRLP